jgi:uncharacterized protein (TIGR03000 family)
MRSLVLSLFLWLAALATLGAPPAADAQYREGGLYAGPYPSWRGGSHNLWRGGSHYFWPGGSHFVYPGGYSSYYPGYSSDYYSGDYNYYRPGISVRFGTYPYSSYGNDYTPPFLSATTPRGYAAPPTTTTIVPPPTYNATPAPDPRPSPAVQPDSRAHLQVHVPSPDAQLFFDGSPTRQKGTDRLFASPALALGQTYQYVVEARWTENGRAVDQTRSVTVSAGQTAVVDFTAPEDLPSPPKPSR